MIKVHSSKGDIKLKMSGAVNEITADACVILQAVYMALEEQNVLAAISFRNSVCNHILEGRTMRTVVEGEDAR